MSKPKTLEKAAKEAEEGKHLKKILNQFCKKNNISYPKTVLPKRNGARITIGENTYTVCDELVLSWDGKECASLKEKMDVNSYLEKRPQSNRSYVSPKQKSYGGHMIFNRSYTLEGFVNGEKINLEARVSGGSALKMYIDKRPTEKKKIPKKTIRMDNNKKYWFLIPAA